MGSNVSRMFDEMPSIPNLVPSGVAFDVSILGIGKKDEKINGKSSTGFGTIRDDKYANLGTVESRRTALMSISLQTFLEEAMSMSANGGPRDDQEILFNCGLAERYPLQFAAMVGDVKKIRHLVRKCGADPNAKAAECQDVQALSYSARYGHLLAVIALLMEGADPFEINKSGQNALSESYKEGHLHVTYFLKEVARRFKAYFAAKRLSGQLGVACCDHCLDVSKCKACGTARSSSSGKVVPALRESQTTEDEDEDDNDSVANGGSVVTEHMGGGIRSSLAGPYNEPDAPPLPNSPFAKMTKVRSDRFSVPRPVIVGSGKSNASSQFNSPMKGKSGGGGGGGTTFLQGDRGDSSPRLVIPGDAGRTGAAAAAPPR